MNNFTIKHHRTKALLKSALMTSGALIALVAGPASAQDTAPTEGEAASFERIIVTATKRSQSLHEVPQAITAIDSEFLKSINAASLEDFAAYVPSVDFQFFAPGQTRVTVRGISPDEQTGVSTVSFYFDEIAITSSEQRSQPDAHLYDIERVEFLRGPQGTLYGEGAMGGTIRIISNKPDTSETLGSARASMGLITDGDLEYSTDAMVNIPIIKDLLAVRVVGHQRQDGGWIDFYQADPVTSANLGFVREDVNEARSYNYRVMARLEATDNVTIDATYIHNLLRVSSSNLANDGDSHVWFDLSPRRDESDLYNVTATIDLEAFSIVSASSLNNRNYERRDPEFGAFLGVTESTVISTADGEIFTQELRLVSADEGPFRWTIGGYYRDSEATIGGTRETIPVVPNPGGLYTFVNDDSYTNTAIFGEVEYDITDRLTVLAGLRAFWEEQDLSGTQSGLFVGPTPVFGSQSRKYDDVNKKFSISYDTSDEVMVYASYSEGFRSGGFNGEGLGVPETYRPDTTANYEAGVKYLSEDGSLMINAAAFYIDWTDLQFIQLDPAISLFFTFVGNANEASSKGVELEITYRPTDEAWISFGGNYTDAQLESDARANLLVPPIIPAGTKLPGVPEYKFSIAAGYDIPIDTDVTLSLSGGITFVDDSFSKLEQGGQVTIPGYGTFTIGSALPGYETANFRAQLGNETLSAALYVTNAFNERAKLGDDNFGFLLGSNSYYNQPRTIGVEVNFAF